MTEINTESQTKQSWAGRNRRHLIAVCMILLMIAFLMPSQLNNLTRSTNPVIGKLGDEEIRLADLRDAKNRWNLLKHIVVEVPRGQKPLVNMILGDQLVMTLDQHPEAYMLLLKESYEDGPGASDREVDRIIQMGFATPVGRSDIEIILEDNRVVGITDLSDDYVVRYRIALADLIAIFNRYLAFETSIKPSAPLIDRRLAATGQKIKIDLMDFLASDYIRDVPQATDEQLQSHFRQFAGNSPGEVTPENEFGFGYKVPNRIKLQAIRIPTQAVRELVRNSRGSEPDADDPTLPYKWVVEAYKYYSQNESEFIPEADPSTQPSTAPTTLPNEPRPFPIVRRQLVERLINIETVRTMQQIQQRIRNRMEADYQLWKMSHQMNTATTQTSLGVPFESIEYLNALVSDVEEHFKIKLSTASYSDQFYDMTELATYEGIGQAVVRVNVGGQPQLLPFPSYAIELFVPFIDPADVEEASQFSLEPFELSDMVQQFFEGEDQFLFRVIDYEATHVASEMGRMRSRVEQDWKRAEAMKLAMAQAESTLKTVARTGQFVSPTQRPVMRNMIVSFNEGAPLALGLEGDAGMQFIDRAASALLDVNLPNNLATFAVPLADRAFLAKREEVTASWTSEPDYELARAQVSGNLMAMLLTPDFKEPDLAADRRRRDYFDIQSIYKRNNFEPARETLESAEPTTRPAK